MPLHIIRQDITKIECDAIVNSADPTLLGGGGVDGAIHKVAGSQLLDECKTLGGCQRGEAKITKGYNLPCKYVIHTVGPVWQGGAKGEKLLLEDCFDNSLALAKKNLCQTVAFPLISAGAYGYPKDQALAVAIERIGNFLLDNEMTIYLVVFDKGSFKISKNLVDDVAEYIDDNYLKGRSNQRNRVFLNKNINLQLESEKSYCCSLEEMLKNLDDNFQVTLFKLIDLKGMDDVECYKKANVSKQTWYKILNEKDYKPSKNTVLAFAIALQLSLEQTKQLLKTVGFALSKSNKFDVIIEYFLVNEKYDMFTINETLFHFDQPTLGF